VSHHYSGHDFGSRTETRTPLGMAVTLQSKGESIDVASLFRT
jgi:hypothetical protein